MQLDANRTTPGIGYRVPGTGAIAITVAGAIVAGGIAVTAQAPKVGITSKPAEKKVEVTVDGKPFTTYMWPDSLEKPVLYPIDTAAGAEGEDGLGRAP